MILDTTYILHYYIKISNNDQGANMARKNKFEKVYDHELGRDVWKAIKIMGHPNMKNEEKKLQITLSQ